MWMASTYIYIYIYFGLTLAPKKRDGRITDIKLIIKLYNKFSERYTLT